MTSPNRSLIAAAAVLAIGFLLAGLTALGATAVAQFGPEWMTVQRFYEHQVPCRVLRDGVGFAFFALGVVEVVLAAAAAYHLATANEE